MQKSKLGLGSIIFHSFWKTRKNFRAIFKILALCLLMLPLLRILWFCIVLGFFWGSFFGGLKAFLVISLPLFFWLSSFLCFGVSNLFLKASQSASTRMKEVFKWFSSRFSLNIFLLWLLLGVIGVILFFSFELWGGFFSILLSFITEKYSTPWFVLLFLSWEIFLLLFCLVRCNFILPLMVDKKYNLWMALKTSRKMTEGHFFGTATIFFLKYIPLLVANFSRSFIKNFIYYDWLGIGSSAFLIRYVLWSISITNVLSIAIPIILIVVWLLLFPVAKTIEASTYYFLIQEFEKEASIPESVPQQPVPNQVQQNLE